MLRVKLVLRSLRASIISASPLDFTSRVSGVLPLHSNSSFLL